MIQGTASDVGKSIVVTAICRILSNDGYRVAPFKAQNMALNSTVTKDGKEIGRAQGVQAEAARTEPKVEMNPILLKPVSDNAAQVVVEGKPIGNMSAEEYFAKKSEFLSIVESSINKLKEDYDFIVIEGAGSPAEINLKHRDIVNMETARMAKSPVQWRAPRPTFTAFPDDPSRGRRYLIFLSISRLILIVNSNNREWV